MLGIIIVGLSLTLLALVGHMGVVYDDIHNGCEGEFFMDMKRICFYRNLKRRRMS